jgi:hypothetical protein
VIQKSIGQGEVLVKSMPGKKVPERRSVTKITLSRSYNPLPLVECTAAVGQLYFTFIMIVFWCDMFWAAVPILLQSKHFHNKSIPLRG